MSCFHHEDVVQESYLRAWKSFHRFTPGTNCRAWLFKILIYVIHNHRRKWFNRDRLNSSLQTLEDTLVYDPPLPETLSDEEILQAFQKLPSYYADVVVLADVHELTYKEIQQLLEIPLGTVMSRLCRGRRLLRLLLADFAQGSTAKARSAQ